MKQEKEEASTEVTEVAPGILRLQLPIEFAGLGHVNCYALLDDRGVALVDPGLPGPTTRQAIEDRLASVDIPLRRVHTVVVTHSHPDHFGGADLIASETGAEVITHERFRTFLDPDEREDEDLVPASAADQADVEHPDPAVGRLLRDRPSPWGGTPLGPPPEKRAEMRANAAMMAQWFRPPRPTRRVADGDRVELGGRAWTGLFTPGHTDDHLCLHDPETGVVLAGDQVLPTITPHVSGYLTDESLSRYLDSLDRLAGLDAVEVVLPAHGHPFGDLAGRVTEIKEHHDERLEELLRISGDLGWASVVDLSQQLFAPRSWGSMAEDETYAHLEHLRLAGRAERREEAGVLLYRT